MHNSAYACLPRPNSGNQPTSGQEGVDRQNSLMFTKIQLPKLENDLQNYNLRLDTKPNSEQSKGKRNVKIGNFPKCFGVCFDGNIRRKYFVT